MNRLYKYKLSDVDPLSTAKSADVLDWCESLYICAVDKRGKNINKDSKGNDTILPKWFKQFGNHGMGIGLYQEFSDTAKAAPMVERLKDYVGLSNFDGLGLVVDSFTNLDLKEATDYLKVIRANYPHIHIHLVGSSRLGCAGAMYFAANVDECVVNPGVNCTYEIYKSAYLVYTTGYLAKKVYPLICITSVPEFQFNYSRNRAIAFHDTIIQDKTIDVIGIWNHDAISAAGNIMGTQNEDGGLKVKNSLKFPETATTPTEPPETGTGQTEVSEVTLSTIDARLQVVEKKLGIS
jgi:hypothetical protein